MSFLMGKDTSKMSTPQVFAGQEGTIKKGLAANDALYDSKKDTPFYQGDLYAGLNGTGQQVLNQAQGFNNYSQQLQGLFGQSANNNINAGQNFGSNAQGIFDSSSPAAAMQAGGLFANSGIADGMVDAASRDTVRNLNEQQLPGINRAASGSGNLNSSRAGAMSAVAQRGADDRVADISSKVRGGLFDQGVGAYNNSQTNRLGANAQVGDASNMGAAMGAAGLGAGSAGMNSLMGGAGFNQADQQGQLDGLYNKWMGQDTRGQQLFDNYWNSASKNIGQQGTEIKKHKNGLFDYMNAAGKAVNSVMSPMTAGGSSALTSLTSLFGGGRG